MHSIGPYRVLGEVARGGMGAVYRALDPRGRQVALKLVLGGASASTRSRRRFHTEVRALQRARHPHVVELLDHGEHTGLPYLVMEWVEGETLAARLVREGPLRPREAAALCAALGAALARCHGEGVLHRDLKPDNVLLRSGEAPLHLEGVGHPLLTDFGLAKELGAEEGRTSLRTQEGGLLGTARWAPLEQLRGEVERIGPRSDVYGLGALLYAALTGEPPREADTALELLAAAEREPDPPSLRLRTVPRELDAIVVRCLAARPEDRPVSAELVADELRAWLDGRALAEAIAARPRSPRLLAGLVVVLGSATGGALIAARRRGPESGAVQPAALGSAPATPASARDAQRAAELAEQGWSAWQRGDPEEMRRAERDLALALDLDPGCGLAWIARGCLVRKRGDPLRALEVIGRGVELAPLEPRGYWARAETYLHMSDWAAALADGDLLARREPGRAVGWVIRARARQGMGQSEAALADATRAVELEPEHAGVRYVRANIRVGQEDLAGTVEDASVGLRGAEDPMLRAFRAYARAALGELEQGQSDADRAVELAPGDPYALATRSEVRRWCGDAAGAAEDAERAVGCDPKHAYARSARSAVRLLQGDVSGAVDDSERAVALDPTDPYAHIALSDARRAAGDPLRALESAKRALQLAPRSRFARMARALALVELGAEGRASGRAELEELLANAPERSPLAVEARRALAR